MEKALAYIRVSSDEQAKEGVSLDAQEQRVRAYAEMRGLDLVGIYREEGVSAGVPLSKRPEGSRLVAGLGQKKATHVIAVKLDRLFRNTADALNTTSAWDKSKFALHVLDMGGSAIDTSSAIGKMFLTMIAGFAEMEKNLAGERTKAALGHQKASGNVYSRVTPFGFDRQGDKLEENPSEMATVSRMQLMRESGLSLQQIADALNQTGAQSKLGGTWYPVTVQKVLKIHATSKN